MSEIRTTHVGNTAYTKSCNTDLALDPAPFRYCDRLTVLETSPFKLELVELVHDFAMRYRAVFPMPQQQMTSRERRLSACASTPRAQRGVMRTCPFKALDEGP